MTKWNLFSKYAYTHQERIQGLLQHQNNASFMFSIKQGIDGAHYIKGKKLIFSKGSTVRAEDLEHEKQLLNQKLQAALKQKELEEKRSTVKLPKLSITPFSGTAIGWVRFKNQFSAMVDSQSVPAVTKFSHLKELLVPKVRQAIDGLPFNEGYERAKKYLREKYGHPDEVAGT